MTDWRRLLPLYWVQLYSTDRYWSDLLDKAIDKGPLIVEAPGTAAVGGYLVSTRHWPFGYGAPRCRGTTVLPTVAVRRKLRRAVARTMAQGARA